MTLNYEHSLLFSGSEGGSLAFIAITDRPKGSIKDISHVKEVLIHGKLQRTIREDISSYKQELNELRMNSKTRITDLISSKERDIDRLTKEL